MCSYILSREWLRLHSLLQVQSLTILWLFLGLTEYKGQQENHSLLNGPQLH